MFTTGASIKTLNMQNPKNTHFIIWHLSEHKNSKNKWPKLEIGYFQFYVPGIS